MSLKIELEVQEVQVIMAGLAKLPLESSIDTWFKVKNQAEAQMIQQQAPVQTVGTAEPEPSQA